MDTLSDNAPRRFYFLGVTTGSSSIRPLFPQWCAALGLNAELVGLDLPLDAPDSLYRETLEHIAGDPLAAGALVTSHKMGVIRAGRELFTRLDPLAERLQEVACIVRRPDGSLEGSAKDPITCMQSLSHIVPNGYWRKTGAHALCLGLGGSGQAFALGFCTQRPKEERPERVLLAARNVRRIEQARTALEPYAGELAMEFRIAETPAQADDLLSELPEGSLVVNATGMGKDVPGSPLTDSAVFPVNGIAWDFNYRGDLTFLRQAERQRDSRGVRTEDGWVYFLYGWTQVMAEVFGFGLDEATFQRLAEIAEPYRPFST